jgi:hypothetical protein
MENVSEFSLGSGFPASSSFQTGSPASPMKSNNSNTPPTKEEKLLGSLNKAALQKLLKKHSKKIKR